MPSEQFKNLPIENQKAIIQASLREFAEHGYDLASTNRIVEHAGISKGVLFKYFKGKESLFLYVCQVTSENMMQAMPTIQCDDLFEFLKSVALQKIRFSKEQPLAYQLLMRIGKDPKHPVYAKVMHLAVATSQLYMEHVVSLLPRERLRDGLTWENVLSVLSWTSQGLQEKHMASLPDIVDDRFEESLQPVMNEMDLYFDVIKFGIYQEVSRK